MCSTRVTEATEGTKGRLNKSTGIVTLIAEALAKVNPTEPLRFGKPAAHLSLLCMVCKLHTLLAYETFTHCLKLLVYEAFKQILVYESAKKKIKFFYRDNFVLLQTVTTFPRFY